MCPVAVGGRQLLATGGSNGAVRLWDPVTGQQAFVMDSHPGRPAILIPNAVITPNAIITMCPIIVGGRPLLAISGADRTVRLWDLATRRPAAVTLWDPGQLFPPGSVAAMCPVIVGGRSLLAVGYSGDVGGEVRLWDLTTGRPVIALRGHRGTADAMCPITINPPEPSATATVGDRVVPLPDSPPAS